MDAIQLFLLDHARIHTSAMTQDPPGLLAPHVADDAAERHFGDRMGDLIGRELTDDQLREPPGEGLNSVAWNIWHMARSEDAAINVVLVGRDQVLEDGWLDKLAIPFRHIGSDMTRDEVATFNDRIDVPALREYWSAVGRRTRVVVGALTPDELDRVVADDAIDRLQAAGALSERGGWVVSFWSGRTKGWFLSLVSGHSFNHFGAATVSADLLRRRRAAAPVR